MVYNLQTRALLLQAKTMMWIHLMFRFDATTQKRK